MEAETYAKVFFVPVVVVLLFKVLQARFRGSELPLPPRPPPSLIPFVGNLKDVTGDVTLDVERYDKKCKELDTDILYLNVLGFKIIFLNTYEATTEILGKNSSIYAGRPRLPMINELMGWDFHFALMTYGDLWRRYRKLMYQHFNAKAVKDFRPLHVKSVRGLLKRLRGEPEDVVKEMRRMSGETIMSLTYGINSKSSNDYYIRLAEAAMRPLHIAISPGAFFVDALPWMKYIPTWFPGASFKRKAREWKGLVHKMVETPFREAKEAINNGTAEVSFVKKSFEDIAAGESKDEEDVEAVAGALYQAGSESTMIVLSTTILALLEHPEVVKKAQKELDAVVLPGSLPDYNDMDSLPYMTAIVKEVLRWHPISPTGLPHIATSEGEYKGYRIPKGAMFMPNNLAILHDEKVFPNPKEFKPERFLKNDEVAESRLQTAWGYGRRVCAGRFMAFEAVWIAIASILTMYDISKPIDKSGNIIHPTHEYTDSVLPVPAPFKAVFTPRSSEADALVKG